MTGRFLGMMGGGLICILGIAAAAAPGAEKAAKPPSRSPVEITYMDAAPFYLYERKGGHRAVVPGIVISGGTVTSKDIAAAVNDETKFKKQGNTVTLLTNLLVKWDGGLRIENEKWIFGRDEAVKLETLQGNWGRGCVMEVQGALVIDNSEITSLHHGTRERGMIRAHSYCDGPSRWKPEFGWTFKVLRSKISYMAWVGQDMEQAHGGPKEVPVFAGNEVLHCADTPRLGGYIVDNWFHDNDGKMITPGKHAPDGDGNALITIGVTRKWGSVEPGIGLFDGNIIEKSAINYLSISWGLGATVSNNIYRNIGAISTCGRIFRQKEGGKGTFLRNNLFCNGKGMVGKIGTPGVEANPAILYSGSTHDEWGEVTGNIFHQWEGTAMDVVGNGFKGRRDVKCRITGNFFFLNSKGILLSTAAFFQQGKGPVDVVIEDNSFFDSGSGISGEAEKLVRRGNFVDGKFVDDAPKELKDNFIRLALAPAAVWHGGRIQTLTLAVAVLKPFKNIKVTITTPGGKKKNVTLTSIAETDYPYDYIGEFSTKDFKVGKGTVTVVGLDKIGGKCEVTREFEVRSMPFSSQ